MEKLTTMIPRLESIITGKDNLIPLYIFSNFPVFFGCVETLHEIDLVADMEWVQCPESGVIQLRQLLPPEILYQAQHMDGVGETWDAFYDTFTEYIVKKNPKNVLEIGGGNACIAKKVVKNLPCVTWTIIDPNPIELEFERIIMLKGFFDTSFFLDQHFDMIVFSHTLEHTYNPSDFLQAIRLLADKKTSIVFAYPHLKHWLQNKFTSALNFEHTYFLTDYFLEYLLTKSGFRIDDKKLFRGHSLLYTIKKSESTDNKLVFNNKFDEYRSIFLDFAYSYKRDATELNKKAKSFDGHVYLFGAHINSLYLLNSGLDSMNIEGVLDNSKLKQSKRLYGTPFIVYDPKIITAMKNIAIILKASPYRNEIAQQIHRLNSNAIIFE